MTSIKAMRDQIEIIDTVIIRKLSQRYKLSLKIGQMKIKSGMKIIDKNREKQLLLRYEKLCLQYHLPPKQIKRVFKLIIAISRGLQK